MVEVTIGSMIPMTLKMRGMSQRLASRLRRTAAAKRVTKTKMVHPSVYKAQKRSTLARRMATTVLWRTKSIAGPTASRSGAV